MGREVGEIQRLILEHMKQVAEQQEFLTNQLIWNGGFKMTDLNNGISVLEKRLHCLDNQYSKQPTLRLKTKIGEIWIMIQELKDG